MDNNYLSDARKLEADLTAFMQDIIRIPSLSSQEGNVIERIRQEMQKLDFDEVTVDPMGNLIGRIGSGPQIVALDGHVDTVDVGDRSLWDREPFSGDVEDGVLYGRGTSDMKGGVASSVYAGGLIKKRRANQETWYSGQRHAVRHRHRPGRGLRRTVLAIHCQGRRHSA
jgi:acetylornithine deacetylase/succinyl-diaminopimelate desuccinylase-like protein